MSRSIKHGASHTISYCRVVKLNSRCGLVPEAGASVDRRTRQVYVHRGSIQKVQRPPQRLPVSPYRVRASAQASHWGAMPIRLMRQGLGRGRSPQQRETCERESGEMQNMGLVQRPGRPAPWSFQKARPAIAVLSECGPELPQYYSYFPLCVLRILGRTPVNPSVHCSVCFGRPRLADRVASPGAPRSARSGTPPSLCHVMLMMKGNGTRPDAGRGEERLSQVVSIRPRPGRSSIGPFLGTQTPSKMAATRFWMPRRTLLMAASWVRGVPLRISAARAR